jgi:hypothetical protein
MEKETGRKKCVYGGYRPRSLFHDVMVTEFAVAYRDATWTRGNNLERNCDGIMERDGKKAFLELETGSHDMKAIRRKWRENYSDCNDTILVVALDEEYLEELMIASEQIAPIACFGVLKNLVEQPHGNVWRKL